MKPVASDGPDDWFFDEQQQRWLRHSGVARWKRILAERRRQAATPEARAQRQALLDRYGITADGGGPDRPGRRLFRAARSDGYPGVMRRPDIELTDEAAAYVEQHPDEIARLAANARADQDGVRARVRARIREQLAAGRTEDARSARQAAGQTWLAKYAG
jgi:hypothetical protein